MMSDEDRDIDVESDEDEISSYPNSHYQTQAQKRAHHNALERKRRDHIKESFTGLRDAIPSLRGEKASRAQILKRATEYIIYVAKRNDKHQSDIDDVRRQNTLLDSQIRKLERSRGIIPSDAASPESSAGATATDSSSDGENFNAGPSRKRLRSK
ncbi:DgyrCDS9897 [Dimorphilus gyrociliatus]|uniref:Protein max n=1 Tax=Dimorphilus gyrociliatus TaxID=2664684 RepID=A0A7I8VYG3_9ANNE|nr:DgyrCDS9897 [Dimorphilus gyrociliatus]